MVFYFVLLSLPTTVRETPDLGIAVLARTRRACHAIEQGESISAQFSASKSVEVRPLGSLIRAFSGCSKAAARGAAVLRNAGVASCCVAGSVRHADFWLAGIRSRPKGSGTSTAAIKTACWLQCALSHERRLRAPYGAGGHFHDAAVLQPRGGGAK